MATENITTTRKAPAPVVLQVPPAGQTVRVALQPNQIIEVPFDMAEANITLVGNDLRFEFAGNAVLILTDFATMVEAGTAPLMMFADGSVVAGDVILTALSAELPETAAGAGAGGSGGAGEYEDDMGDLIAGVTRLGPQNPDPFAKTVEMSLLDEQPLLPEVPAPVNNPPVAEDNVYRLTAGQLKAILANEGLFSNDYDPDGDPISFIRADNPPSVTINKADGSLTIDATTASELYAEYQALDEGETLSFTFPYTIADPAGLTATAKVTIIVEGVNDPPTITTNSGDPGGANDVVYESGLYPHGTNAAADTEFADGTFKVSDADGLDDIVSVTITGAFGTVVIPIDELGNKNLIKGAYGNLTITGYDSLTGEGSYKYELTRPTTDVNEEETAEEDSFTLTTSDGTVTSAPAAITIEIIDDFPKAVSDYDGVTIDTDGHGMTTGDVQVNDKMGADGPETGTSGAVTSVTYGDETKLVPEGGSTVIKGTYGELTISSDGTYSYNYTLPPEPDPVIIAVDNLNGAKLMAFDTTSPFDGDDLNLFAVPDALVGIHGGEGANKQGFGVDSDKGPNTVDYGEELVIQLAEPIVNHQFTFVIGEYNENQSDVGDMTWAVYRANGSLIDSGTFADLGGEQTANGTYTGAPIVFGDEQVAYIVFGMNDPTGQGYTVTDIKYVNLDYKTGIDDFTYTVTDGDGDTSSAHLYITSDAYLEGDAFDNQLTGDTGDDILVGLGGADTMVGSDGDDILSGGSGGDIFAYSAKGGEGIDTIKDFSLADGDVLRFHDVFDGIDDGSDLGVADVNASVFAAGDDITITINETTQVVIEGLNSQIGLSDGAHTLADLPASMLDFTTEPHTI